MNIISTSTHTITTNGKTLNQLTINGAGVTATLGDALTVTNALTVTQGTFSTSASNFAVTCGTFSSSNSNTRTISFNGSTVTANNISGTVFDFGTQTNLTFNAGTSTVILTGSNSTFNGNTRTFYNLEISGSGADPILSGNFIVSNNLILSGDPSVSFAGNFTYAGLIVSSGSMITNFGNPNFYSYGQTIGSLTIYVPGGAGTITLQDNLTVGSLNISGGTLATNNKSVTVTSLALQGSDATNRALSLGSSIINASQFVIDQSSGGTSTIAPGTSQIIIDTDGGGIASLDGTAFNLNRLSLGSTTNSDGGVVMISQTGSLLITVADYLSLTGYVLMGHAEGLTDITLTGALHLGGTPSLVINSDDATQVAFNVSGAITTGNSTLTDINASGSGTAWNFAASGATITDGGNNTGITFPLAGSVGTATGTSSVSGVGRSISSSVGSSTGSATAAGVGASQVFSIGTSIGASSVTGIGLALASSIGTSVGVASVSGVGGSISKAVGTTTGIATVLGVSPILIYGIGTAIGICAVQAQGNVIPTPPSPSPTEYGEGILTPIESAIPINTMPTEYGESIRKPIEYAA